MSNSRLDAMFKDIDKLTESGSSNNEGGNTPSSDPLQYIYEQLQLMNESELNKVRIMLEARQSKVVNEQKAKEERLSLMFKGLED